MNRILLLAIITFSLAGKAFAQNPAEVIDKYLKAIGGKEKISQIKSLYTESTMAVMSMEGKTRTTIVNGKGMKQETEMMSQIQTTCISENGGWATNPFQGSTTPIDIPAEQYNLLKSQITIGAPFINYQSNNMKVESAGNEAVGSVNAVKIKMIKPDNTFLAYYFDPSTFYLIKSTAKLSMQGQEIEMSMNFLNYRDAGNGYMVPFTTETEMGNGMKVVSTTQKVEVDKPVDPAIFNKP